MISASLIRIIPIFEAESQTIDFSYKTKLFLHSECTSGNQVNPDLKVY
jgi:hypothetical protein